MQDTTIHSVQSTMVCCVSGERTERCVATLSTATAVCGMACCGWQPKTKQRNCRNCCLSGCCCHCCCCCTSARNIHQHSDSAAAVFGQSVQDVTHCVHSARTAAVPPPPRNNNNNSNDSPSDPLLATHATKTFIGERKNSTAPFVLGGKII